MILETTPGKEGIDWAVEGDRCVTLLSDLIRIPTVNRGDDVDGSAEGGTSRGQGACNERPAAELLAELLRSKKLEPVLLEPEKNRTSVVTRLRGTGEKPAILLNAHLDVVEADASKLAARSVRRRDPRRVRLGPRRHRHEAHGRDERVRLVPPRRARGPGRLSRDVIFAGVADEEAACTKGSLFLVDEHPERVRAEYMLGEIGAFSQHIFGRTFYPIRSPRRASAGCARRSRASPGHGSMPKGRTPCSSSGAPSHASARRGCRSTPRRSSRSSSKRWRASCRRRSKHVLQRLGPPGRGAHPGLSRARRVAAAHVRRAPVEHGVAHGRCAAGAR